MNLLIFCRFSAVSRRTRCNVGQPLAEDSLHRLGGSIIVIETKLFAIVIAELELRQIAVKVIFAAVMIHALELTFRPADLGSGSSVGPWDGDALLGVAQVSCDDTNWELEKLFVDMPAIGSGIGRQLFAWAVATVGGRGGQSVSIVADPHSAAFYRTMGARDAGRVPSASISGRSLRSYAARSALPPRARAMPARAWPAAGAARRPGRRQER